MALMVGAGGIAGCASNPSGLKAAGASSDTPSTAASTPLSSSVPTPKPSAPVQRVAEVHSEGGLAGNQQRLQPPAIVVFSDGTVVLEAAKTYKLDAAALSTLMAAVRGDLNGLPETVNPSNGRSIPDIATTVLGVRKADGGYQTVRAAGLPQIGKQGGYPAPLVDAYTKLQALDATAGTPFAGTSVRYQLACPVTTAGKPQPWPAGMPQPISGEGPSCVEVHEAGAEAAAVVRGACQPYFPADLEKKAAVPYQSDKGVRTCQWRYALPDETS